MRVISYGGGVQSTALVVLAVSHVLDEYMGGPVEAALFANVGDDSEDPLTLDWVRDVVKPWVADRLPVIELERVMRDGSTRTLHQDLMRESRSVNIPVRMANGAPGNRNCTGNFKIGVIERWLREQGVTAADPATVAVGISLDEIERVNTRKPSKLQNPVYPLIDLRMDRAACQALNVAVFGKPAPKSSCYFCPFRKPSNFSEMRRDRPELFEKAAVIEDTLNVRRAKLGKDSVYLTRFGRPLREAVGVAQDALFSEGIGEAGCDEGYCWT